MKTLQFGATELGPDLRGRQAVRAGGDARGGARVRRVQERVRAQDHLAVRIAIDDLVRPLDGVRGHVDLEVDDEEVDAAGVNSS